MPTAYDMPQMPDTKPGLYYVSVVRNGREWRPLRSLAVRCT